MNRRFFAMFLAIVMIVGMVPFSAFAATADTQGTQEKKYEFDGIFPDLDQAKCIHFFIFNRVCVWCGACNHDYKEVEVKEGTCVDHGYVKEVCTRCNNESGYETEIKSDAHSFTTVEKQGTCSDIGCIIKTCELCGKVESKETGKVAGNHPEGSLVVETEAAECEKDGYKVVTCKACGYVEKGEEPALGHKFKTEEKQGTCSDIGCIIKTCERCGKVESKETGKVAGNHTDKEVDVVKAATCKEKGLANFKCLRCGANGEEEIPVDEKNHEFHNAKCVNCGEPDPKCPHPDGIEKWEYATCTADGIHVFECPECGFKKSEVLEKTGHDFHNAKCVDCGEPDPKCPHPDGVEKWEYATCTADGIHVFECPECGFKKSEVLEKTGHNFVDGKCDICGASDPDYVDPTTPTETVPPVEQPEEKEEQKTSWWTIDWQGINFVGKNQ